MSEKSYVVVTEAVREKMWDDYRPPACIDVKKTSYQYHRGQLGLLHPLIVEFFSDYEQNVRKAGEGIDILVKMATKRGMTTSIPTSGLMAEFYRHKEGDIPILTTDSVRGELKYVMLILSEGEFEKISGTKLLGVQKEVKEIYQRKGIVCGNRYSGKSAEETLEMKLKEQWKTLECFEQLRGDLIETIPIEVAQKNIPEEVLIRKKDFLKNLYELDLARRRSWAAAATRMLG